MQLQRLRCAECGVTWVTERRVTVREAECGYCPAGLRACRAPREDDQVCRVSEWWDEPREETGRRPPRAWQVVRGGL